ncbi:MAG TPA: alpha/beta hydrolase [Dongiaceae bacterium]|nr:alpha/beta hydrolase [Dongiaceae bacterium]
MGDPALTAFAAHGLVLPPGRTEQRVAHDGASIWCAVYGPPTGRAVILLHGGFGHSGNFANQIPALTAAGYRAVVIDSRGHGRSTRDARPYSYERMAGDVVAVMDALGLAKAALIGWSDGACIAMTLAKTHPERVAGVFFFACNMDPSGIKEIDESNPLLGRCFGRHAKDYAALSATPDGFQALVDAVTAMQRTQPDWSAADLASLRLPVASAPIEIVWGENEEFIRREHLHYLARTIPGATSRQLPGVSHFAPIQDPDLFNAALLDFLGRP